MRLSVNSKRFLRDLLDIIGVCRGTEWLPGSPPCPSLSSPPIAIAPAPRGLTFVFEAPNTVGKFGEAGDPGILLLEFA